MTFTTRDLQRLVGVIPLLVTKLGPVFDAMSADKTPMFIVGGVRTIAEQQADWRIGRDAQDHVIGRVVTYKDGIIHRSNHQPHADGFGYAVDCAFVGLQPFDRSHPWHLFGERLEAQGLKWGGRWGFGDLDHAELPDTVGLKA